MERAAEHERDAYTAWPRGCWPNENQLQMLKACLLEDTDAAQDAYRRWERQVPFFFIDGGSQKLLLLLYQRLQQWNMGYHDFGRLRGAVRYYWVQRQGLERELASVLETLARHDIPTLLLKGAALNGTAYEDGARLMSDLDVVVPRRDARQAMAAMQAEGWTPQFRDPDRLPQVTHGCHFRRGAMGHLDLHWDFFHGRHLADDEQEEIWQASHAVERGGTTTGVLCPADQLLHTCEHGLRYNETPPIRWLADAYQIIRRLGDNLDWQRLTAMADRYDLRLPVQRTLKYLRQHFALELPDAADELLAKPTTWKQRAGLAILTRKQPGSHVFWRGLPASLLDYRRLRRANVRLPLLEYLARVNDIEPPLWKHMRYLIDVQIKGAARAAWRSAERVAGGLRWKDDSRTFRLTQLPDDWLEGFHAPELGLFGSFRWSQPTAAVRLPIGSGAIRRGPLRFDVMLLPFRPWTEELHGQLSLRLNRTVIPRESLQIHNRTISFTADAETLFDYHLQRLELRCPAWDQVPQDPRQLGLPLSKVRCTILTRN